MAEITVYECREDAPELGLPQFLIDDRRSDWWWDEQTVGLVPGAKRTALPGLEKPLATGAHRCGTEDDFRLGGEYLPDVPPVERRPDGLPVCCGAGEEGQGGGMGGGTAVASVGPPADYCFIYHCVYLPFGPTPYGFAVRQPGGPPWWWLSSPSGAPEVKLYSPEYDPLKPYWWLHYYTFDLTFTGPPGWDGQGTATFTSDPTNPPTVGDFEVSCYT